VSAELALGFMAAIALIAFAAIVVQSRPLRGGLTTTGIVVGAERRRTTQLSNATGGRGATSTYAPVVEWPQRRQRRRDAHGNQPAERRRPATVGATVRSRICPGSPTVPASCRARASGSAGTCS
jgi:hypothetical protein